MPRSCSVEGCERGVRAVALGLCDPHYKRVRRTGDVQEAKPIAPTRRQVHSVEDVASTCRTCPDCTSLKSIEDFHRDKRGPGGYRKTCKTCRLAGEAARYSADPERHKTRVRQYRQENLEHVRAQESTYYQQHHAQRVEAAIAHGHIRRARILARENDTGITVPALKKLTGTACHYCAVQLDFKRRHKAGHRPDDLATLDHKTPLAKDGTHTWGNCTLACWRCNITKGTKPYAQFVAESQARHGS